MTLPELEREWHDTIAKLQRIGAQISEAKNDPLANPFEGMRYAIFEQAKALRDTEKLFQSTFIKPLP